MRICIVNDHFSSGPGGQHRVQNLGLGLSRLGHEVLYASPYGISYNLSDLYLSRDQLCRHSAVNRYLRPYFDDFFKIFKMMGRLYAKSDLVLIELPNTMMKALSGFYGSIEGTTVAFDLGGLWTSTLDKGRTYPSSKVIPAPFRCIAQLFEDGVSLISAMLPDVITVATTPFGEIVERFLRVKTHLVYHPVDVHNIFNPSLTNQEKLRELVPERLRRRELILLGVKGDEWFASTLFELIRRVKGLNVAFIVLGSFPVVKHISVESDVGNYVFFTGNVTYGQVPYYVGMCKFGVVLAPDSLRDLQYAPHNISKIADLLAAGKPVITNTLGAIDYISDYRTGFVVENQEQMIDRFDLLLHDQDLLFKMSMCAREFACDNLNYTNVAERYLHLIK